MVGPDGPGRMAMSMGIGMAALTAILLIVPFLALAIAALRFGADSRPGIDDPDQRPWMVG
jgi:Ca2+/H+ antiporter